MSKDGRKVVIRMLPPDIGEEDLIATFPLPVAQEKRRRRFHPGKRYKIESKFSRNATCYLALDSPEQVEAFIQSYHGHAFVDEKGEAFRAVCAIAPYQRLVKSGSQMKDKIANTIECDPMFIAWDKGEEKPAEPAEGEVEKDPNETPLLNHIRNLYLQRRKKERKTKATSSSWWAVPVSTERKSEKCYQCGSRRRLEDADDQGNIYCSRCWDEWQHEERPEGEEEEERPKREREQEERNCPAKHGLKGFIAEESDWWCSLCRTAIQEGKMIFGCRKCDYDLCKKCYQGRTKDKKKEKERWRKKEDPPAAESKMEKIAEEEYEEEAWDEKKKKKKKKDDVRYSSMACQSCGTHKRVTEDPKTDSVYCEKCWAKWGKERWVQKK